MIEKFIYWQKRFALVLTVLAIILAAFCFRPAIRLLTTVSTDLIHLLPNKTPSVKQSDEIKKIFNRRSSLFILVHSENPEINEQVIKDLQPYIEQLPEVGHAEIEKQGYDFFDKHKLLLVDFEDLSEIKNRLHDRIQKKKLGGIYIDLEDDEKDKKEDSFDDLTRRYKDRFVQGVQSRYRRSEDGKVYTIDVYPKSYDSSIGYFKTFGKKIEDHISQFDFSKYPGHVEYGFAGTIKTRVEQYDALMRDLKVGGTVSMSSIFVCLFFYFLKFYRNNHRYFFLDPRIWGQALASVVVVFSPMVLSTLYAFAFCSLFFERLNIVTSFLFAIIFGLGVDIGIHLMTRALQDRRRGLSLDVVHKNIFTRTGKSCATSVLTTVTSYYILVINDFKGFSEFGWIAGNGLIVALLTYLIIQPCLVILLDRYITPKSLLGKSNDDFDQFREFKSHGIPRARIWFGVVLVLFFASTATLNNVQFEWNFGALKMKIAEREKQKHFLRTTVGRVNSPAAYIVNSKEEAKQVVEEISRRKKEDKKTPTIDYVRSYWGVAPEDQKEKLAILSEIKMMLEDDALNAADEDEQKLIDEFKEAIKNTEPITEDKIPQAVYELFWGNTGQKERSMVYVAPLPDMQLDDGRLATAFLDDVGEVKLKDRSVYAVSDSVVFAEVIRTLFKDSRLAVFLSASMLTILIVMHYRDVKRTVFVLFGLTAGIFWMFSLMEIFGLKLNFYNMIVIPAMIGMGEDNSVHLVDRFEEGGRRGVLPVLLSSGQAAFMASLTTILGYAGLCFTHHPGLQSIGWMAITGMGTCLVGSLGVLPLLLQLFLKPKLVLQEKGLPPAKVIDSSAQILKP